MKKYEFLTLMSNLERSINALADGLKDAAYDNKEKDAEKWLNGVQAYELAKAMTYTKLAISAMVGNSGLLTD